MGGNFQVARNHISQILLGQPPGTFAFYRIDKAAMEHSSMPGVAPQPRTRERALGMASGREDLADLFMVEANEAYVGLAYATAEGVERRKIKCTSIKHFQSRQELVSDMIANNIPIDPQKFIFPGMNYMPVDDE